MSFTIHKSKKKYVPTHKSIGERYARLLVIGLSERVPYKKRLLLCQCDCGNKTFVSRAMLKSGNTRSCGCLRRELASFKNRTHGESRSEEYLAWLRIKNRCYDKNSKSYKWYGARGIVMCERWKESFENFLKDIGRRPSKLHSIERRDNSKGYTPDNCRWATPKEQANNKRNNHMIEFNGKRMTLMQWGESLGVPNERIRARLKLGYTTEQAITLKRYELR